MSLVHVFGTFSLRCFLSQLVALSLFNGNLSIEFLSGNANYDISLAEKGLHL